MQDETWVGHDAILVTHERIQLCTKYIYILWRAFRGAGREEVGRIKREPPWAKLISVVCLF